MSDFFVDMKTILDGYDQEVRQTVNKTIDEIAEEAAGKLRQSNNGGAWKKYPKSWKARAEEDRLRHTGIVYNQTNYQLTHLLEFGHVLKRGGRTIGQTRAFPHIEPVNNWVEENIDKRLEDNLTKEG